MLLGAYLNYLATTSERTPILTYAGAAAGHVEYSVDVHYEAEVRVADRCAAALLRAGTDALTARCAQIEDTGADLTEDEILESVSACERAAPTLTERAWRRTAAVHGGAGGQGGRNRVYDPHRQGAPAPPSCQHAGRPQVDWAARRS